jgi:hypothetical protein
LRYNEEKNASLKRDSIDWFQSRVIFVSPFFTIHQKKSIEFKDMPIELLGVKEYSNKTIYVNQMEPNEKTESMTKLVNKYKTAVEISKEIKVYNEKMHLEGVTEDI